VEITAQARRLRPKRRSYRCRRLMVNFQLVGGLEHCPINARCRNASKASDVISAVSQIIRRSFISSLTYTANHLEIGYNNFAIGLDMRLSGSSALAGPYLHPVAQLPFGGIGQ
jgi:hypothetical protein